MYDYVGNRNDMTVTDGSGVRKHVYSYDALYQITDVNYPSSMAYLATDTKFRYDAAGNRIDVNDGSGLCRYTSNNLNQYTAAGTSSFSYDHSGNMTADGNCGNTLERYPQI
jgi:YD repeat-containing protein